MLPVWSSTFAFITVCTKGSYFKQNHLNGFRLLLFQLSEISNGVGDVLKISSLLLKNFDFFQFSPSLLALSPCLLFRAAAPGLVTGNSLAKKN